MLHKLGCEMFVKEKAVLMKESIWSKKDFLHDNLGDKDSDLEKIKIYSFKAGNDTMIKRLS